MRARRVRPRPRSGSFFELDSSRRVVLWCPRVSRVRARAWQRWAVVLYLKNRERVCKVVYSVTLPGLDPGLKTLNTTRVRKRAAHKGYHTLHIATQPSSKPRANATERVQHEIVEGE